MNEKKNDNDKIQYSKTRPHKSSKQCRRALNTCACMFEIFVFMINKFVNMIFGCCCRCVVCFIECYGNSHVDISISHLPYTYVG